MSLAGVVFDIGGVVQDSPLHAIARYERERGIEPSAINRAVVEAGERGAWARLERGELTVAAFCAPFEAECRSRGIALDARRLMATIAEAGVPRPRMLEAIRRIRARGLRVAALTNNWVGDTPPGAAATPARGARALWERFDVVVESAVVGLRKPDPKIYTLVCEKLALAPARVAFLDDIGRNLKPARELGMATIKVDDPDAALAELGTLLGFELIG
jgi:putative hydrolase of the HAD superfamily